MSMIERVARAVYASTRMSTPWETIQPITRQILEEHARAAIEAMREPTEAMNDAARDWSYRKYGKPIGLDASAGCFEAMIEEALK